MEEEVTIKLKLLGGGQRVLRLPTGTTALQLESIVTEHETAAPVGKWKLVLLPSLLPKRVPTPAELREEIDMDLADRSEEDKGKEITKRMRALLTSSGRSSVLSDADKTLEEYGVNSGSERVVEVILDFSACHMDRSLRRQHESKASPPSSAAGQCHKACETCETCRACRTCGKDLM